MRRNPIALPARLPVGDQWPRWAAFAVVAACLGAAAPSLAAETGDLDRLRDEALALVNAERRAHGLATLDQGDALNAAAQSHAEDMLRRGYYSHTSPGGGTVQDRYAAQGGSQWRLVAENIARCDGCPSPPTLERVRALHRGWMNSPEHRRNILMEGLTHFGFGLAAADDRPLYAVQTFAGPGTSRGDGAAANTALDPDALADAMLEAANAAREREGLDPLARSEALGRAAATLLPTDGSGLRSDALGDIAAALPEGTRGDWASLSVVAGACGGCGTRPTAADVQYFRRQWLDDRRYAEAILAPDATHLGFAMRASGEGRKLAITLVGRKR